MELQPYESSFIVFRNAAKSSLKGRNYPEETVLASVDNGWNVTFQEGRGAPGEAVTFDNLSDWTASDDLRIKYFSGTATYANSFILESVPGSQVYVDLGKVMVMAKVKVNGEYAGGVWTAPYRVNVTNFLKEGENTIEVEVVNCWRNRLIGEKEAIPEADRFTFQTSTYLDKNSELQSSGLLGPVRVLAKDYELL